VIDLHVHTVFSDGELIPAELVRRLEVLGYEAVCLADHADSSSIDFIVPRIVQVAKDLNHTSALFLLNPLLFPALENYI